MSGYKIVLPTSFTDAALPVLGDDPLLTAGSLLLVEPGHPASMYRGALADGDLLDNIAWKEAQQLAGGTEKTLKSRFERSATSQAWWSAKGNSIQWLAGGGAANKVGGHFPLPVLEHLRQNPWHDYLAIAWVGLVAGSGGVNGRWSVVHFDPAQAVSSIYWDMTGTRPGNVNAAGAEIPNENAAIGHRRVSAAAGSTRGPIEATAAQADTWSRYFGNIGANPGPSGGQAIFHRFYLEDLTVSGRSAADVDAADKALYIRHCLTAGGRHYGERYELK